MALKKALSKSAEFVQIDIQDGSNNCGIVRFHSHTQHERVSLFPNITYWYCTPKIALLTLAYEISIEAFSVQFNWKDCSTEAVNRMKVSGHHTVTPETVMTWNRRFRVTETFAHPHENEKSSKPFVF
jgi:hypothetical protein